MPRATGTMPPHGNPSEGDGSCGVGGGVLLQHPQGQKDLPCTKLVLLDHCLQVTGFMYERCSTAYVASAFVQWEFCTLLGHVFH